jgi:F420-dependent oxidoreductase-like protein
VSGPQVVEGWYGAPFGKPLARTREYVDIVRQVLRRDGPVALNGEHYALPYQGPGAWGLGKPLKSITHPLRSDLPIFLGAEGPKNVTMAAEIADGWLPLFYSPYRQQVYADQIAGARPGFEIMQGITVVVSDDVEQALLPVKQHLALYIGGMGAKSRNFHNELVKRMGFEEAADTIQTLFLDGRRDEAVAAVPTELADEISLVGPVARIRERLVPWRESPVTSLLVSARGSADLQTFAELVLA